MVSIRTSALVAVLAAASVASAQDKPDAPKPEPPPAAPAKGDAAESLERMETLHLLAIRRVPPFDPEADAAARAKRVTLQTEWEHRVDAFVAAADEYMAALHGAEPSPKGLYLHGVAKEIAAEKADAKTALRYHQAAAESLQRYLDGADERTPYRADAEMHLGRALVFSAGADATRFDASVAHLQRAVQLLQEDGRHDEAGKCAAEAMAALSATSRSKDLAAFATAIHASDGDFGTSTPTVRQYVAAARFSVGAPLPELPAVADVDGQPIAWKDGKPLLLHFFLTADLAGRALKYREIELEVRPLWDEFRDKGLRVVGVSMDREIPRAEAEAKRKSWDEQGRNLADFRDGSLESVREWTKKQRVEWPWYWDGKATQNPLSTALGREIGVTEPYAVLVDRDGIVRWKGKAPFEGLADEVGKVVK